MICQPHLLLTRLAAGTLAEYGDHLAAGSNVPEVAAIREALRRRGLEPHAGETLMRFWARCLGGGLAWTNCARHVREVTAGVEPNAATLEDPR